MKTPSILIAILLFALGFLNPHPAFSAITLSAESEEASTANVEFGSLKSLNENGDLVSDSAVRTVTISLVNTSGKQYQVTQRLAREFLNEMHSQLADDALTFFTYGASTSARQLFISPQPVSPNEEVIFISDAAGTDDSFKIQYTLTNPAGSQSGRYTSDIIYRVVEIE